jgi:serine/threonine protein kinase
MSPEQAMGKDVTAASDIFSLGILYYEMLTGIKPFVKDDKGDILEKIIRKGFRPPRKLNPAIPWRAARIIRQCLRKKPKRRFKDIGQVKVRLEKILRRTSIDHSRFLQKTFETLVSIEPDPKGPPNVWKRIGFRLTHMRIQTYIILGFGLFLFMFLEILVMSRGIGLTRQVRKFRSLFHGRKAAAEVRIPENARIEPPSGTVMTAAPAKIDSTSGGKAGQDALPDTTASDNR